MRYLRPLVAFLSLTCALAAHASVQASKDGHGWSLISGPVEYRLHQNKNNGAVVLTYFGPKGGEAWKESGNEISGLADGQELRSGELTLEHADTVDSSNGRSELHLRFRHKVAPLEIEAIYTTFGDTGVITRRLLFHNTAAHDLLLERAPSLTWRLPGAPYELSYLHGNWGEERQLATVSLSSEPISLVNRTGRSSAGFSPWFVVHDSAHNVRYGAQLAYSGNWESSFQRITEGRRPSPDEQDLQVNMGMRFDFDGPKRLPAGETFALPDVAFTASTGDLDDLANQFHRYQRDFVFAHTPANAPPQVSFNIWQMLLRFPTAAEMKHYADITAPLGIEVLIIDAGWHMHPPADLNQPIDRKASPIYGDWRADSREFPHGLREVADDIHAKGMKFGVWEEVETVGTDSPIYREHPDWVVSYNGKPLMGSRNRAYLNFNIPAARDWAKASLERLINEDKVDWIKIDYNVNLGEDFDPATFDARTGSLLHDHLEAYYKMLDELRAEHPNLILENCASGGLRTNLAIMHHMHTAWTSDVVRPQRQPQLDYGCTLEFAPEICNHWVVGDPEGGASGDQERGHILAGDTPGWMETVVRMPMAGQMGWSSNVDSWPPAFRDIAIKGIADYKRIRPIIAHSDVYHLTAPPAQGDTPRGWLGLEFNDPTAGKAVLLAVRLTNSNPAETFHIRGLDPAAHYRVTGEGLKEGDYTGATLAQGLTVNHNAEWDSSLIEITKVP